MPEVEALLLAVVVVVETVARVGGEAVVVQEEEARVGRAVWGQVCVLVVVGEVVLVCWSV